MGKQFLKRFIQRLRKISISQITLFLLILSCIGFIISTTQVFTNSRSVTSFESHVESYEIGYGVGENTKFMYYEIYIEVKYAIHTQEYENAGLPSNVGITVIITDNDSNEIVNEQLTPTAKRTYICETRSFSLKIDQFTEFRVVYFVKVKKYFFNPTQTILTIFFSFLLVWAIGMGVIFKEKQTKRKRTA